MAAVLSIVATSAQGSIWYARAKGTGDGKSAANPMGSPALLEKATKPGDVIILLSAIDPFEGGLALKSGQTLLGFVERGRKPSITNTDTNQSGGSGIVLADGCRVIDVRVEGTRTSGVLGFDASGVYLLGVEVSGANKAAAFTRAEVGVLGRISHGGILFINSKSGRVAENSISQCVVANAAGFGIGAFAIGGAQSRLTVSHTCSETGALIPPLFDAGIIVFADGRRSEARFELADSAVSGRMSDEGRNVIVFACAEAKAATWIERSTLGACGQDGVAAVAAPVPATVEVEIRDSIIEKAGQMNIEGTILNLPPSNTAKAGESVVSIDVRDTTLRDAGAAGNFRSEAQNIWLAPTSFGPGPFAKGRYTLTIRNSVVSKASHGGIGSEFKIPPDEGDYEVSLHDNVITGNGLSEIAISALGARIDARQNYWGTAKGLMENRVVLFDRAKRSQLDASEPRSFPLEPK